MTGILIGTFFLVDFHELDSWKRARFVVCTILELTRSSSLSGSEKTIVKAIDRLSISILDNLARGYERHGNKASLIRAKRSIVLLEGKLKIALGKGILDNADSALLAQELKAVKHSLMISEE